MNSDRIRRASCAALFKGFLDTPPKDVYIEWDGKEKSFDLQIRVCDADTGKSLDTFAKSVPVRIAEASTCDCGGKLTLGDYSMTSDGSDFLFHAEYFCQSCRTQKQAEQRGFRKVLSQWLSDIKSIKVGLNGAEIERGGE